MTPNDSSGLRRGLIELRTVWHSKREGGDEKEGLSVLCQVSYYKMNRRVTHREED